jgi:hypothetical protein
MQTTPFCPLLLIGLFLCATACAQTNSPVFLANYLNTNLAAYAVISNPTAAQLDLYVGGRRNTNCWLYGINGLTGISTRSCGQGNVAWAISPRHVITAHHIFQQTNLSICFVATDNTVVTRTIIANTNAASDIDVNLLDSDLPPSIQPLPIMSGADWTNYLPILTTNWSTLINVATLNQDQLINAHAITFVSNGLINCNWPTPALTNYDQNIGGGSSGSPIMFVIGTNLVAISHLHFGNPNNLPSQFGSCSGDEYVLYLSQINVAMSNLSLAANAPIYSVNTNIDFSLFSHPTNFSDGGLDLPPQSGSGDGASSASGPIPAWCSLALLAALVGIGAFYLNRDAAKRRPLP